MDPRLAGNYQVYKSRLADLVTAKKLAEKRGDREKVKKVCRFAKDTYYLLKTCIH